MSALLKESEITLLLFSSTFFTMTGFVTLKSKALQPEVLTGFIIVDFVLVSSHFRDVFLHRFVSVIKLSKFTHEHFEVKN